MGSRAARPIRKRKLGIITASVLAVATAAATLTAQAGAAESEAPPKGAPASEPAEPKLACGDGSYNAEVVKSGSTWTSTNGGQTVYTGSSMLDAVGAALGSLTEGRTSKEGVVVRGDGDIPASSRLSLPSYTLLDVCGTMNVTGSGSGDMAPIYARDKRDIEIPNLKVSGTPVYGVFMRNVENVSFGQVEMNLNSGLGVRIDNRGNTAEWTRNINIDNVYVSGASSHAVETYGVDGLTIGTVTARDVGECGLLLNQTINADIGTVDADNAGAGTGYAAFRMANRNGRVGDSYANNIHVGEVIARGGGRGIFCVSESGGAVIDRVDIADTGNNAILLENCYNVTIAESGGTVAGPGDIRLAARSEFANTRQITLKNFTLSNSAINESPCAESLTISNITFNNSANNAC